MYVFTVSTLMHSPERGQAGRARFTGDSSSYGRADLSGRLVSSTEDPARLQSGEGGQSVWTTVIYGRRHHLETRSPLSCF